MLVWITHFPPPASRRIIPAKRIQCPILADHVRAAAVDAVLIPAPGVHERLDEQAESVLFLHFEAVQDFSQFGVLATALDEIGEFVADLVAEKSLKAGEVNELGNTTHAVGSP